MKLTTMLMVGAAVLAPVSFAQAQTSGAPTGGTGDARQQMLPSTQGATSSGQMSSGQGMNDPGAMPTKVKRKKKKSRRR